jgi:hypothetical protein
MTTTLGDLTARHGFDVLEHLEAGAEVPILEGLQAQGDLFIIPVKGTKPRMRDPKPIPAAGLAAIEAAEHGKAAEALPTYSPAELGHPAEFPPEPGVLSPEGEGPAAALGRLIREHGLQGAAERLTKTPLGAALTATHPERLPKIVPAQAAQPAEPKQNRTEPEASKPRPKPRSEWGRWAKAGNRYEPSR